MTTVMPASSKPTRSWLPDTSGGFWRICLIVSLILNLVIIGLFAGHLYRGNPMNRPPVNYGQFVPRQFFFDIDRERRNELDKPFRDSKDYFESLRAQADNNSHKFADILTKPDFNINEVNTAIDAFTTGPDSVSSRAAGVLKDFFAKLTPDERQLLAKDLRDRPPRNK